MDDFQYQIDGLRINCEIPGTELDGPRLTQTDPVTTWKGQETDRRARGVAEVGGGAPTPVMVVGPCGPKT